MANKILSLSEEDAEVLRRFIRELKQHPRPQSRYHEEREIGQSPEVYVAKTPPSGIPAIIDFPGTSTSPDIPGSAECEVYRATVIDGLRRLVAVTGLKRLVHSLSYTTVPGNIYVKIERDKFGVWWLSSTPAQLSPGPDTPVSGGDTTGTGDDVFTGTGTGDTFDCPFSASDLLDIAGDGLVLDFTEDCPRLKVETTPPSCIAVEVYETDLRCEEGVGTGTSQEGSLNLYRRLVSISIEHGCPTVTRGEWEFVKAVACCDPECTYEERFWWCINDNEPDVPTEPVETGCCPDDDIPPVLEATISDVGCWSNPVTLTYDPVGVSWSPSGIFIPGWYSEVLNCHPDGPPDGENCILMIYCREDSTWSCRLGRKAEEDFEWTSAEVDAGSVTCNPFEASFIQDDSNDCNLTSPFTIDVVEP